MPYPNDKKSVVVNQVSDVEAEIEISGEIGFGWFTDGVTKEDISAEIKQIANLKASVVNINLVGSLGGDVNEGLSISDLLGQMNAKRNVKIHGLIASISTAISSVGDFIEISDNSLYLIHHAMTGAGGNVFEIQQTVEDLKAIDDRILNIYVKNNRKGKTYDEIKSLMDENNGNGKWITANEAVEWGFVDAVFESKKAVAMVSLDTLNRLGLPSYENVINQKQNIMEKFLEKLNARIDKFEASIKEKLGISFKNEAKTLTDKDGKVYTVEAAGAEIAVGDMVKDADGNPAADASIEMEDGTIYKTDADGKISEIVPKAEQTQQEGMTPEEMQAKIDELTAENSALKAEKLEMQKSVTAINSKLDAFEKMVNESSTGTPKTESKPRFRDTLKTEKNVVDEYKEKRKQEKENNKNK